ncbi:MAG: N-6 DNA methylase [Myxococcales bacterium]|nr:N-6 DNA methylase [Myxococcales bacterium]
MVQPIQGLVVSVPALVDAQCARPATRVEHAALRSALIDGQSGAQRLPSLTPLLEILGYEEGDFDFDGVLPDELSLWVPEGRQHLRPTRALRRVAPPDTAELEREAASPGAGRGYVWLAWELPSGLDLDRPETTTGEWHYPPAAKFERLLRHVQVPVGLLFNGDVLRLVVAPHGEASGAITFGIRDMAGPGGQDIFGGLLSLLSAQTVFTSPDRDLHAILRDSRRRQADVTAELARQVFEAIELLLAGFEECEERGDGGALSAALEVDDDHVYRALLTVLLRLVFLLYAEDRGLMPVDAPLYGTHLGVLGLWEQLHEDAATHADTMHERFGAWPRLLALFRAVYHGMTFGDLRTPPRHGMLFDPELFPFLEGRRVGEPAPRLPEERATVRTPAIHDATVYGVLRRLLILDGQRLSYQALDVEQIGSVYERLMGYHVARLDAAAVCLRDYGVWVTVDALASVPSAQRVAWLREEAGLSSARATALAAAWGAAEDDAERLAALEAERRSGTKRREENRLVLQPGTERRRTSSHYTPRSLSSRMVRRALEPLFATMGPERTAESLLALKICDPAMGSGAFLVETCRVLADEVVAAWTREGVVEQVGDEHGDPVLHARRLVAQRCLYGVDKNRFAVDLAKLSMWLVTLAADQPFTFVDHALRHGDALVGLDINQIQALSWEGGKQQLIVQRELNEAIERALRLRREILDLAQSRSAVDAQRKVWLLRDADDAMERARLLADVVVGAFFAVERRQERKAALQNRRGEVLDWLASRESPTAQLHLWQAEARAQLTPLHWMLEFPEVFAGERPDPLASGRLGKAAWFDCFVGNPPFGGKNNIAASGGPHYIEWLQAVHPGAHGNADLSAHFFLRAAHYLGEHGTAGLIATNTIGQGDTRATGLQRIVGDGAVLYDAVDSMPWPGEAGVTISTVHLARGECRSHVGELRLNGLAVAALNSRLAPRPERPDPVALRANAGKSFQGSIVLGMGFTLTPEERDELVARDPRNAERIFPYIGGQEVNSSPTQDFERYVINFGQMTLEEAEQWPDLIGRVRELAKPERDRNNRDIYRRLWWQFGEKRVELYRALTKLSRCLVTARVSKHCMFSFQSTDRVFSEQLFVFPLSGTAEFAVLQSSVHVRWSWTLSSSMKSDLRYSATDCFENFPFPAPHTLAAGSEVEQAGDALYAARASYMVATDVGLTTTYNRLRDPACDDAEIVHLRELHEQMDRVVLAAYGWSDLEPPAFQDPASPGEADAKRRFEGEIIDRLFALNAARAAEEREAGAGTPAGPRGPVYGQPDLFGDDSDKS